MMCVCDSYKYRQAGRPASQFVSMVSRAFFVPLLSPLALCDIRPDAPGIQLVRLIELLLQQICCPFATLTEWRPVPSGGHWDTAMAQ